MAVITSRPFVSILLALLISVAGFDRVIAAEPDGIAVIDQQISEHAGTSGVLVLDKGKDALLARAWLTDHARHSIDVQYFIWSTDNIGILAAEALLRAAERGVKVRVIVDDLLIDAPDESLLALALHPNIDIRIYNPKHSVGTPLHKRVMNLFTDFRGFNQRMHNKTFIVDAKVSITGGRNMADEYFDYDHEYNFRDRDVLLIGHAAEALSASFKQFWDSELSVPVEQRFDGFGLFKKSVSVNDDAIQAIYHRLHAYAQSPENFSPVIRQAIDDVSNAFDRLVTDVVWSRIDFISDLPGKNDKTTVLGGGGLATSALADLVREAREEIIIQSPYVVLSDEAIALFQAALDKGISIQISTNSLASTDNLQAFSGYKNQRRQLIDMGLNIYEFQPHPALQLELLGHYAEFLDKMPVSALHAKTMVIDSKVSYIGTYNLDPRSENLNTEAGAIIHDETVARQLKTIISIDMRPENSWNAKDDADRFAPLFKRQKVLFWQFLPIKPLL